MAMLGKGEGRNWVARQVREKLPLVMYCTRTFCKNGTKIIAARIIRQGSQALVIMGKAFQLFYFWLLIEIRFIDEFS